MFKARDDSSELDYERGGELGHLPVENLQFPMPPMGIQVKTEITVELSILGNLKQTDQIKFRNLEKCYKSNLLK